MKRPLSLLLILSLSAYAAEPSVSASSEIPRVVERPETHSAGRFALAVSSASLLAAGTSVAGGVIATQVPAMCTRAAGEPKPMCMAAGIAIAGATQLLVQYLLLPELFRISGDDPSAVRRGWWQWARWPALALAASTLAVLAGAAMENKNYGSGQAVMMGGMAGSAVSGVTVDVLGIIGAVKAAKKSRKR
jgi:hypothetical protein